MIKITIDFKTLEEKLIKLLGEKLGLEAVVIVQDNLIIETIDHRAEKSITIGGISS